MLYKLLNKKTTITFISYFILCQINAQINPSKQGITNRPVVIDITNKQLEDYNASILKIAEIRKPAGDYLEKKNYLNIQRALKELSNITKSTKDINGIQENKFISNILQFNANSPNGTPNDNSVAISDSGYIVSVVNTNLVIYNDTGKQLLFRNLGSFASSLTLSGSISDPRVIFDPIHRKFIIAFFSGNNSSNSTIVLAFSQSANPLSPWNFYALKGNPNNDTTWSDYPIISVTKDDFFITFNQLKDNEGWKTGFRYAAIWQVDKQKGFNGDSIKYNYWDKIKYNNKSIWSICPVMKSGYPTDNKSYFTFLLGSIARSLQMDRQAANDDLDDIRRDENLTVAR